MRSHASAWSISEARTATARATLAEAKRAFRASEHRHVVLVLSYGAGPDHRGAGLGAAFASAPPTNSALLQASRLCTISTSFNPTRLTRASVAKTLCPNSVAAQVPGGGLALGEAPCERDKGLDERVVIFPAPDQRQDGWMGIAQGDHHDGQDLLSELRVAKG